MYRIFTLFFVAISTLVAQTSLWEISNGEQHLYIGGTVHLLRPSDYPLPPEFEAAFDQSDRIVFETDLGDMASASMQGKLVQAMSYGAGDKLSNHISAETFSSLEQFLTEKGVPIIAVETFRPSMVAILIAQLSMNAENMVAEGVDHFFYTKAIERSLPIDKLETIDEQIAFLSTLGENNPDEFILNAMEDSAEDAETIAIMVEAWRSGDEKKLYSEIIQEVKEEYPDVYKSLLTSRNDTWYPQFESMLLTEPTELILVGAGHLVGEDGVLEMFRENGYSVSHFETK